MLHFAQLDTTKTTPSSLQFDDIYFSPHDGIGESQYHFIEGNDLVERFQTLFQTPQIDNACFTVAETGFGTGLNFILTGNLWFNLARACQLASPETPMNATLHYISAEKYPIEPSQLAQIYQAQGWTNDISQAVLSQYPTTFGNASSHEIHISHSKIGDFSDINDINNNINIDIKLTLLLGDASDCFRQHKFIADAWFLDGFAPNKNPDMWTQALFDAMATHSQSETTFATFTAASAVRCGLQEAGFEVYKGKGFGRKRERLLGRLGEQ